MMTKVESKHQLVIIAFLLTLTFVETHGQTIRPQVKVTYDEYCLREDRLWVNFTGNCTLDEDANENVIVIGYLGSFTMASNGFGKLISGAIPQAIEQINK